LKLTRITWHSVNRCTGITSFSSRTQDLWTYEVKWRPLSTRFTECADRLRPSATAYKLQRQGQQAKN